MGNATTNANSGGALSNLPGGLNNAFSQPGNFLNTALSDLVAILQDAVLAVMTVAQDVADGLLAIAADAVSAMITILEAPLNIPILSWLFFKLTNEQLNLLNVMTLIFAFPVTIVYKVTNNNNPPFTSEDVTTCLKWTLTFPSVGAGETSSGLLGISGPPVDASFVGFLMMMTALLYGVADATGDILALAEDPGVVGTFLSVISIALSLGWLVWGAPWSQFSKPGSTWTGADVMYVAMWIAAAILSLTDIGFFAMNFFGPEMAKLSTPLGQGAAGLVGVVMLGFAIAFTVASEGDTSYSDLYRAGAFLGSWPSFQKIVLPWITAGNVVTGALILVLAALDLGCDIASGALSIIEDQPPGGTATQPALA